MNFLLFSTWFFFLSTCWTADVCCCCCCILFSGPLKACCNTTWREFVQNDGRSSRSRICSPEMMKQQDWQSCCCFLSHDDAGWFNILIITDALITFRLKRDKSNYLNKNNEHKSACMMMILNLLNIDVTKVCVCFSLSQRELQVYLIKRTECRVNILCTFPCWENSRWTNQDLSETKMPGEIPHVFYSIKNNNTTIKLTLNTHSPELTIRSLWLMDEQLLYYIRFNSGLIQVKFSPLHWGSSRANTSKFLGS